MIQSMTGYGKSKLEVAGKTFVAELKSLNSKHLDASVRLPSEFRELELPLRNRLSKALGRGKVDLSLQVEKNEAESSSSLNSEGSLTLASRCLLLRDLSSATKVLPATSNLLLP